MSNERIPIEHGITLLSGQSFDFRNPGAQQIAIEDIATNLSNNCRFAGAVIYHYSIAQHSINVSRLLEGDEQYDGLMHDTSEALTNDMVTPLKFQMPAFKRDFEGPIELEMSRQFNFNYPLSDNVKRADMIMLVLENEHLRPGCALSGCDMLYEDAKPYEHLVDLSSWSPADAKTRFLDRYEEISR